MIRDQTDDPHGEIDVIEDGAALETATAAVVSLHGRGATAHGIIDLPRQVAPESVALMAPQAAGLTWYPYSFLEPTERNEPHLSSALRAVERIVDTAADAVGYDRVLVAGFSQGGCLACEFVGRNGRKYGGLAAFSGGVIGDHIGRDRYDGSLDRTPVYLGCSDIDPHIPVDRVHDTATVLEDLGADVTTEIFSGMGHTINDSEMVALRDMIDGLV